MSEYYAVQRSNKYLEHYGIKGMKWGVRKAIESGNFKKLSRQYAKASKKLAKLQNNANVEYQKKRIKNATNKQKIAAIGGAINLGVAGGATAYNIHNAVKRALKNGTRTAVANAYFPVGTGLAAGDIVARQIAKRKAKKLASSAGHKEASRKANEFRKEMAKSFKGTKFAKNIGGMANDIAARKRSRVERNVARFDRAYANSRQGRIEAYANNPRQAKRRKRRS